MRRQSRGGFDLLTFGMMALVGVAGGFLGVHVALGGSLTDVKSLWAASRPAEATIMIARNGDSVRHAGGIERFFHRTVRGSGQG